MLGVQTRIIKYSISLNGDSYFTKLVILDAHVSASHSGCAFLLNFIRFELLENTISMFYLRMLARKVFIRSKAPSLSKIHLHCSNSLENLGLDYATPSYFETKENVLKSYTVHLLCNTRIKS